MRPRNFGGRAKARFEDLEQQAQDYWGWALLVVLVAVVIIVVTATVRSHRNNEADTVPAATTTESGAAP